MSASDSVRLSDFTMETIKGVGHKDQIRSEIWQIDYGKVGYIHSSLSQHVAPEVYAHFLYAPQ